MDELLVVHTLVVIALFIIVVTVAVSLGFLLGCCFLFIAVVTIVFVVGSGVVLVVGEVTTIIILACDTAVEKIDQVREAECILLQDGHGHQSNRILTIGNYLRMELERVARHPSHVNVIIVVSTLKTTRLG